jgi:catechol 2,3-dioxygenase-like lactoylglutathione lyase family enzyme
MATTTSPVTGVDFVTVPTTDLEATADFYENVLGLLRSKAWQRPGEEALGIEFEPGTVTIALLACERLGIEFRPNPVPIALQVDDVEAARAELESRGVTLKGTSSTVASATRPSSRTQRAMPSGCTTATRRPPEAAP